MELSLLRIMLQQEYGERKSLIDVIVSCKLSEKKNYRGSDL